MINDFEFNILKAIFLPANDQSLNYVNSELINCKLPDDFEVSL